MCVYLITSWLCFDNMTHKRLLLLNWFVSNCAYLVGLTKHWISSTALVDDISDQVFLSIVGGEDADALSWVAQQTHVHV